MKSMLRTTAIAVAMGATAVGAAQAETTLTIVSGGGSCSPSKTWLAGSWPSAVA